MSIVVKLSYEEQILNALSRVERKRSDDVITRLKKEFDAIRKVLQPLYDKNKELREALQPFADIDECANGFMILGHDITDHTCYECENVLRARKVLG